MKKCLSLPIILAILLSACSHAKPPQSQPAGPSPVVQPSPPLRQPTSPQSSPVSECSAGSPEQSPLYEHQVYLTNSSDGITFENQGQLILEHASVPDLVIGPDGALWMYYVNGEPGKHGIFAARQTAQGEWEVQGCVTLDGQFNGNAVDPNVLRLPDGRIRLVYFEGNFVGGSTLGPDDPHPIYSAISEDGLHFTVEGKLITAPDVTDPSMVQLPNGSWLLAMAQQGTTVLATSPDGQAFSLTGVVLQSLGIPELGLLTDGRVALYVKQMYISADGGQTWEIQPDVHVPGGGKDPSLVALPEGGFAFAYKIISGENQSNMPPAGGEKGQPGSTPAFNPFENMTSEQETCLKEVWGEEAFTAITTFQRPPSLEEAPSIATCGLQPQPGGAQGAMPGGEMGNPVQGNPADLTLNLEITAPYLMAFHACDTASNVDCNTPANHQVYLAQSQDGISWQIIPGWHPFQGSVPDIIRRNETLYIYTPGTLTRYHLDSGVLEASLPVTIDGVPEGFVDPSLFLDDQGRLTLFFLYGKIGSDPAGCGEESTCTRQIGSATEVEDSNGVHFTLDDGQRISVMIDATSDFKTASDPDIFFDGRQYVLYLSHGPSISVWTSPDLRGEYTRSTALPQSMLTFATGGVPTGHFDLDSGQYWTYAHINQGDTTVIRRAVHNDFSRSLTGDNFATVISGESTGLGTSWLVASPSFTLNQP